MFSFLVKTETKASFRELSECFSFWQVEATSVCLLMIWFFIFRCFVVVLLESNCSLALFSLQVAIFLIQRNRHALIGRAIDDHDMQRVLEFLKSDPVSLASLFWNCLDAFSWSWFHIFLQVVDALFDCKSEVIGPGFFRFKAEIGIALMFWHFSISKAVTSLSSLSVSMCDGMVSYARGAIEICTHF